MRRMSLILLVLLALLALFSFAGTFLPHQIMMSRMMRAGTWMNFFWPIMLAASTTAVIVGVVYLIAFPSIRYVVAGEQVDGAIGDLTTLNMLDIVMRVSKPDERAVLQVLKQTGGVCRQKDIVYHTRLSKVKTHRIIARLAERGVIEVRKLGKTNEISIPAWLRAQVPQESSP